MKAILLLLVLVVSSSVVQAEEALVSGPIRFSGTGCPAISTDTVVTDDLKTVSLLFSDFDANTGTSIHKSYESKSCELIVPVTVPAGWRIKISKFDFRGFRFLGNSTDLSWMVTQFKIKSRNVTTYSGSNSLFSRGPQNTDFFQEPTGSVSSYACGGAMEIRIKAQLIATSHTCRAGSQTTLQLDSIDFTTVASAGDFQYSKCR